MYTHNINVYIYTHIFAFCIAFAFLHFALNSFGHNVFVV